MPKLEFDFSKIDLRVIISAANFLAIVFVGGMMWANQVTESKTSRDEIRELRAEVVVLRTQATSIAVLQNDVQYIRESLVKIERAVSARP